MSDIVMNYAFDGNTALAEYFLRLLLQKKDIHVIRVRTQDKLAPLSRDAHGAVPDIHAVDSEGVHYDIEMQKKHTDDLPQRGYFYSNQLTCRNFEKGEKSYKKVPKTIIIFLIEDCKFSLDTLYENYHVSKGSDTNGQEWAMEIYLFNTRYNGPLKEFVDFFLDIRENDPAKIKAPLLRSFMVQYRKENEMEGGNMKRIYNPLAKSREEGRKEGRKSGLETGMKRGVEKGRREGKAEANDKSCLSLLKEGSFSEEKIASLLDMSLSRVQELKKTIQA